MCHRRLRFSARRARRADVVSKRKLNTCHWGARPTRLRRPQRMPIVERSKERPALSRPSHPAPTFRDDRPKRPSDLEQDGRKDAFDLGARSSHFLKFGKEMKGDELDRSEISREIGVQAQL